MVGSMTPGERQVPSVINKSRTTRIASGSGRKPKEVTDLVKRFNQMKGMMATLGQQSGMLGKIPGMGKLAGGGMPGMDPMAMMGGGMPGMDPMAMMGGGGAPSRTKGKTSSADRKKKQKQAKKSRRKGRKK